MLQFYPPSQSNSKIVGGLPCPDTVGGLDPSETPVLESYFTFLFRLKLFFMRPKLQEPPRAWGGSHLLSLKCWWHSFSSGSCQFLLILQHLGVEGKWVSEGERMSGPSYSICWAPQHQGRHEHVHSTFPGGRQGAQRWPRDTVHLWESCFFKMLQWEFGFWFLSQNNSLEEVKNHKPWSPCSGLQPSVLFKCNFFKNAMGYIGIDNI